MEIETIISESDIRQRVKDLGIRITADFQDREVYAVAILHGALVFAADLVRHIELPLVLDIMFASSYSGMQNGELKYLTGPSDNLPDRDVLVIDDILDTGQTLDRVVKHFHDRNARSVNTCVLLDKPGRRRHKIEADYRGFEINNDFVVGYGLDLDGLYRNLPYIGRVPSV